MEHLDVTNMSPAKAWPTGFRGLWRRERPTLVILILESAHALGRLRWALSPSQAQGAPPNRAKLFGARAPRTERFRTVKRKSYVQLL